MARTIKINEYAERRNEIIDAAQQLIYTKGYENMSIQDILDHSQISKGAFYHYFDTKKDLIDALLIRMVDESAQTLKPIVDDPKLTAPEKIERFFKIFVPMEVFSKRIYSSVNAWLVQR